MGFFKTNLKIFARKRAFTLVEVTVVVAISGLVGALLLGILIQNNKLFLNQSNSVYGGVGLNDLSQKLTSDIRSAAFVAATYPPSYQSSTTGIILAIPSVDSSGNIIENTYDYVVYEKGPALSNILQKTTIPDQGSSRTAAVEVLTNILSDISFIYKDKTGVPVPANLATKIEFEISLANTLGGKDAPRTITSQAVLRNTTN